MTPGRNLYAFRHTPVPGSPHANAGGNDCDARLLALDDDPLDAWNERVAIGMVDGGLSQEEAEAIAWREVEGHHAQPVAAHVGPGAANVTQGDGRANG